MFSKMKRALSMKSGKHSKLNKHIKGLETTEQPLIDILKEPLTLTEECGYVPTVLVNASKIIQTYIGVKDLFQVQGCVEKVEYLNNVLKRDIRLTIPRNISIHDVAEVIKVYLTRMSADIIPEAIMVRLIENIKDGVVEDYATTIDQYRQLSPNIVPSVQYVLRLLNKVAQHSQTNGMDTRKLATIFVLDILKPLSATGDSQKVQTNRIHQVQRLPYIIMVIEYLIQNLQVFGTPALSQPHPSPLRRKSATEGDTSAHVKDGDVDRLFDLNNLSCESPSPQADLFVEIPQGGDTTKCPEKAKHCLEISPTTEFTADTFWNSEPSTKWTHTARTAKISTKHAISSPKKHTTRCSSPCKKNPTTPISVTKSPFEAKKSSAPVGTRRKNTSAIITREKPSGDSQVKRSGPPQRPFSVSKARSLSAGGGCPKSPAKKSAIKKQNTLNNTPVKSSETNSAGNKDRQTEAKGKGKAKVYRNNNHTKKGKLKCPKTNRCENSTGLFKADEELQPWGGILTESEDISLIVSSTQNPKTFQFLDRYHRCLDSNVEASVVVNDTPQPSPLHPPDSPKKPRKRCKNRNKCSSSSIVLSQCQKPASSSAKATQEIPFTPNVQPVRRESSVVSKTKKLISDKAVCNPKTKDNQQPSTKVEVRQEQASSTAKKVSKSQSKPSTRPPKRQTSSYEQTDHKDQKGSNISCNREQQKQQTDKPPADEKEKSDAHPKSPKIKLSVHSIVRSSNQRYYPTRMRGPGYRRLGVRSDFNRQPWLLDNVYRLDGHNNLVYANRPSPRKWRNYIELLIDTFLIGVLALCVFYIYQLSG